MGVTLSSIISTVRGIVVDRLDDATVPLFTDAEIAKAVNSTVGGFFGFRPEAFSTGSVVTETPEEFTEIGRACLGFTRAGTYADFSDISAAFLGASFDGGKISLNFKTDRTGGLLFFGDPATVHTALLVEATGLRLINSDTPVLDLPLLGAFTDNEWHTVEIELASGSVTMTVGSEAATVAYAGSLVADPSTAYLGRVVIGADEYGFEGYMAELIICDVNSRELIRYNMDDGSGSVLFNSANYNTGLPDVIRVSCTADAAFSGDYALNVDQWEMAGGYSVWKDALWYMSDGTTTYTAPDNGLNTPPATFTRTMEYPDTITVTGAGASSFNAVYSFIEGIWYAPSGYSNRRIWFDGSGETVGYDCWVCDSYFESHAYVNSNYNSTDIPPKLLWDTINALSPAPTLEYSLEATATVSFLSATIYSDPVEWVEDEELDIARWAVQQFCYGVAAFLLMQRGKDAFYREAAAALNKLYVGR